jgi:hypothetical protein
MKKNNVPMDIISKIFDETCSMSAIMITQDNELLYCLPFFDHCTSIRLSCDPIFLAEISLIKYEIGDIINKRDFYCKKN